MDKNNAPVRIGSIISFIIIRRLSGGQRHIAVGTFLLVDNVLGGVKGNIGDLNLHLSGGSGVNTNLVETILRVIHESLGGGRTYWRPHQQ